MTDSTSFRLQISDKLLIICSPIGPILHDGSQAYSIRVEADELVVGTSKSMFSSELQNFIDATAEIRRTGTLKPVEIRSAVVGDFALGLTPNGHTANLKFSLRHGNRDQWTIQFDMVIHPNDLTAVLHAM